MQEELLNIDIILKSLETLRERTEHKDDKVKELLQWNEAIAKDFKEIEAGVSGIRVMDKIQNRNELLNWLDDESKEINELDKQYSESLKHLMDIERQKIQEVQKLAMTFK